MGTTGLVAIIFTDVVGSTEAVARLGDERAEQLRQTHFALLREGIKEHAGTEVKNLGDGLHRPGARSNPDLIERTPNRVSSWPLGRRDIIRGGRLVTRRPP